MKLETAAVELLWRESAARRAVIKVLDGLTLVLFGLLLVNAFSVFGDVSALSAMFGGQRRLGSRIEGTVDICVSLVGRQITELLAVDGLLFSLKPLSQARAAEAEEAIGDCLPTVSGFGLAQSLVVFLCLAQPQLRSTTVVVPVGSLHFHVSARVLLCRTTIEDRLIVSR